MDLENSAQSELPKTRTEKAKKANRRNQPSKERSKSKDIKQAKHGKTTRRNNAE